MMRLHLVFPLRLAKASTTLKGIVTLTGDTVFGGEASEAGIGHFCNEVRGPGSLLVRDGGQFNFYATNSFRDLDLTGKTTVNVWTNGTLGTEKVWLRGSAAKTFNFRDVPSLAVTNEFRKASGATGALNMALTHSKISMAKNATVDSLALTNFSELAIGGTFAVGTLKATGARHATFGTEQVKACAAGTTLAVGDAADSVLGIPLGDGTGTLGLTKKGTGAMELPLVERTYTGPTTVAEGTLKLNDDPRLSASLAYWMDASREEDFEKDASGVITKWHSRGGSTPLAFATAKGAPTWGISENKVNGLNVVTVKPTSDKDANSDQLVTTVAADHRTVFIVCRVREYSVYGGVFGQYNTDNGMRMNGSNWESGIRGTVFDTTGSIRRDGQAQAGIDVGNAHILTFVHDRDGWSPEGSTTPTASSFFKAALGRYNNYTTTGGILRVYDGDYCEILAFDRVLTEVEMRRVENYLAAKWMNTTIWSNADIQGSALLPEATALTVATDGTLDLAGCSVTVASLSGNGTITNSSATPATLTVTGGGSFTGHVGGPTTVAVGADTAAGIRMTDGATLEVTGGTLATGAHLFTPPTNGLAYWCDAGQTQTILTDAEGSVTGWVSRAASSASMLMNNGSRSKRASPVYSATAMGGRPAVYFNVSNNLLWASAKSPVRTVFLATSVSQTQTSSCGLWGIYPLDRGFRFVSNTMNIEGQSGGVRATGPGDWVSLDGVQKGGAQFAMEGIHVLGARLDPANHTEAHFTADLGLGSEGATRDTALGYYFYNYSFIGAVGEVIAYDRALSDSEMRQVENYLMTKWKTLPWTEGNPPAESEATFAEGTALNIGNGARVDMGNAPVTVKTLANDGLGGTLAGSVTLEDAFLVDAQNRTALLPIVVEGDLSLGATATVTVQNHTNLTRAARHHALTATGTVAGEFSSVIGITRPWEWLRGDKTWSVAYSSGTLLIFR